MDLSHFQKPVVTIGDSYGPAMKITDQAEADAYFEALVQHGMRHEAGQTRETAESIQRSNLGYYAGYYDHETRVRVERLFRCRHPMFGPAAAGAPSAQEELEAGRKLGEATK